MLAALAHGDLTERISADYQGSFGELKTNANETVEQLAEIVTEIQAATGGDIERGRRDQRRRRGPRAAHRAAGLQPRGDRGLDGADGGDRQAERRRTRSRPTSSSTSANQIAERGGAVVGDAVDAMSRIEESLAEDRRHHRRDRRDRLPDQPAGAQRRGRGGARRRGRQGLRGGRRRGAHARPALGRGGEGHQGADPEQRQRGQGRRQAGQRRRRGAAGDRRGRSARSPTSSPRSRPPRRSRRAASSRSTARSPRWTR